MCDAWQALHKGMVEDAVDHSQFSGEIELYGVIKGSSEGLGLVTLAGDLGMELKTRVHVDSSAAKGMVER